MVEPEQMQRPRCTSCGGTDILWDAWACWDVATQQWVLHICYDLFDCENCHTQSKYVEFN
jgi:hypothetical protein